MITLIIERIPLSGWWVQLRQNVFCGEVSVIIRAILSQKLAIQHISGVAELV